MFENHCSKSCPIYIFVRLTWEMMSTQWQELLCCKGRSYDGKYGARGQPFLSSPPRRSPRSNHCSISWWARAAGAWGSLPLRSMGADNLTACLPCTNVRFSDGGSSRLEIITWRNLAESENLRQCHWFPRSWGACRRFRISYYPNLGQCTQDWWTKQDLEFKQINSQIANTSNPELVAKC